VTSHTITASAGTGGSITPAGAVTVADAGSQAFSITANAGYVLDQVLVDSVNNAGAVTAGTYSFTGVAGDRSIAASFITIYANWAKKYSPMVLTDPAAIHNGMTNQQLFAFGLDPTSSKSVNPISVPFNKTNGTFSYTRTANSGLAYTVWTSPNLKDWTQDATATSGQSVSGTANGIQTVAVTVSTAAVSGKLFVRVQAQ